jgi:hypothetical protein
MQNQRQNRFDVSGRNFQAAGQRGMSDGCSKRRQVRAKG